MLFSCLIGFVNSQPSVLCFNLTFFFLSPELKNDTFITVLHLETMRTR